MKAKKVKLTEDQSMDRGTVEKSVTNTLRDGEAHQNVTKRIIRVQFDIEYGGTPGKKMDPKSKTMPDMHLTVRQLLENHTRGVDSKVAHHKPLYFETTIPTLNDITDVEKFKENLQERLAETNRFIVQEREQKQREESEQRLKADSERQLPDDKK